LHFAICRSHCTRDPSFSRGRASGFPPLSSIASASIDSDFAENSIHENRLSLRDLLTFTLPFSSSSCFLHNTHSLPLASSSSDAAEQTCVVDSGSHPKRTREGAAAAFPVVEFCNSVRKKKKWRLGSELLQISREPWSIVGRLQLKKRVHNSQVEIWGLLHCISPPFVLPLDASPLGASVAKSAKSLAWNRTQKSIFKQRISRADYVGFYCGATHVSSHP
jgi:hypothetical protein